MQLDEPHHPAAVAGPRLEQLGEPLVGAVGLAGERVDDVRARRGSRRSSRRRRRRARATRPPPRSTPRCPGSPRMRARAAACGISTHCSSRPAYDTARSTVAAREPSTPARCHSHDGTAATTVGSRGRPACPRARARERDRRTPSSSQRHDAPGLDARSRAARARPRRAPRGPRPSTASACPHRRAATARRRAGAARRRTPDTSSSTPSDHAASRSVDPGRARRPSLRLDDAVASSRAVASQGLPGVRVVRHSARSGATPVRRVAAPARAGAPRVAPRLTGQTGVHRRDDRLAPCGGAVSGRRRSAPRSRRARRRATPARRGRARCRARSPHGRRRRRRRAPRPSR